MKNSFKISFITFAVLAVLMVATCLSNIVSAQHLISSKAGFVNRVEGKVYILRQDSVDGEKGRVSLGSQMRDGDKLSTDAGSLAEVLLNPGSYLRINEKSEVNAVNTSLVQVRFELLKGSIIVEVGEVDKKTPIEIITPHGTLFVTKVGLQRIDSRGEVTSVAVRQGEIHLGTREQVLANNAFKIGRGKVAQLTGTPAPNPAKLDKDSVDRFDIWSFNRAETLMAANQMALRNSNRSGSLAYGWFYDPFYSCYTYIPRRGLFWSPYGFGFFNSWGNCFSCGYGPFGYGYGGYGYGGYGGWVPGSGGGSTNLPPRVVSGVDRGPVQRQIEGRRIDTGSVFDRSGGGFGDSGRSVGSPASSTASSSSRTLSTPAPSRSESGGTSGGGGRSLPSRP